jgi:hypothetical protein
MKKNQGPDFIDRTLRTTGLVLLVLLPFGSFYFGFYPALAVFSGGVWGIINFLFLSHLTRAVIQPGQIDKVKATGIAVIKFPLLYLAGYCLLTVKQLEPLHLLAGFSILLAVMLLKSIARALLGMDKERPEGERLPGAVR